MIRANLPLQVKEQLVECYVRNTNLFSWNVVKMPRIELSIAIHSRTVNRDFQHMVQRRKKLPEKAKATKKVVQDMIKADFVIEAKYTTWLSNILIVRKSKNKWSMCVDYKNLNKVCPKDAYPMPNIHKLEDNLFVFKLLLYMDAYSGYNQKPMDQQKIDLHDRYMQLLLQINIFRSQ
jgi:hypothetical protein